MKFSVRQIVIGAAIAAIYTALTLLAAGFESASGLIQVRFSEALCILPIFSVAAVPGLFIGCLVSNIITGAILPDIVFGSLATFLAALSTMYIGKLKDRRLVIAFAPLPAVIINGLVVGAILVWGYDLDATYSAAAGFVSLGQVAACYGIGIPIMLAIEKTPVIGIFEGR